MPTLWGVGMRVTVNHPPPIDGGYHLVRMGDKFDNLYVVRSGSFKGSTIDLDGREHILGFFMPGDLIGFDAIQTGKYYTDIVALQKSSICAIPYAGLSRQFTEIPQLASRLLQMMSKSLASRETLAGDYSAEERCASFLAGMSDRFNGLGYSAIVFNLPMARSEIAKSLRLASETVTRVFARFIDDCVISVKGREITILDRSKLDHIASRMGPLSI